MFLIGAQTIFHNLSMGLDVCQKYWIYKYSSIGQKYKSKN